jgi:hypothetical protein
MPYGEGRSKRELKKIARDYAKTDDNATYEVTTDKGTRIKVSGINSAKAVAGKDGTFKKVR